ncbi:MAG: DUF47 family protein [Elusimicrobiota bacterium]
MFKKFFCRETEFEKYMYAYADNIEKAGCTFADFLNDFDPAKINQWVEKMNQIEHDLDDITHQTMNWLESTFIVNYDREDIHRLASDLDDIVDNMDGAAVRISLYNVNKLIPEVVKLANELKCASAEVAKAVRSITKDKLDRKVLDICKEIKSHEEKGDKIYHNVLASLFKDGNDPLHVIKFKEIVEAIERSLDKCNQSAMNVESIIFKYS